MSRDLFHPEVDLLDLVRSVQLENIHFSYLVSDLYGTDISLIDELTPYLPIFISLKNCTSLLSSLNPILFYLCLAARVPLSIQALLNFASYLDDLPVFDHLFWEPIEKLLLGGWLKFFVLIRLESIHVLFR